MITYLTKNKTNGHEILFREHELLFRVHEIKQIQKYNLMILNLNQPPYDIQHVHANNEVLFDKNTTWPETF